MIKRPLPGAFAAVLCGEVMAYFLSPGWWSAMVCSAFALCCAILRRKRFEKRQSAVYLALSLFLLLGALFMYRAMLPDSLTVRVSEAEDSGEKGLTGTWQGAVLDIRQTSTGKFKVEVAEIEEAGADSGGLRYKSGVIIYTDERPQAVTGDKILFSGTLYTFEEATNPGQFDSALYYKAQRLAAWSYGAEITVTETGKCPVRAALYRLRVTLLNGVDAVEGAVTEAGFFKGGEGMSGKAAEWWSESCGIIKGMFLGEKSLIPSEVRELFTVGGIAHMLAISGLHISLTGLKLFRFLKKKARFSYPVSAAASAAAVACYCLMTGLTASSVRALVMFSVMIIGEAASKPYDMASAMSLAGIILCLLSPLQITHAGFQLSFLSVAAVCFVPPVFNNFVKRGESEKGKIRETLVFGLCLQMVTLPAVAWNYFQFPVGAIFLNLLAVPLLAYVAASSFAAIFAALFSARIAALLFLPAHLIFLGLRGLCTLISQIPGMNVLTGQPQKDKIVIYAGCLIGIVFFLKRCKTAENRLASGDDGNGASKSGAWDGEYQRKDRRKKRKRILRMAFLCVFLVFGIILLSRKKSGELVITYLDVGQGDGVYVEFPSGTTALIDCGSSDINDVGEYRLEPFLDSLAERTPDMVFITHLDDDHTSGIEELAQDGRVGHIYLSAVSSEEKKEYKPEFINEMEALDVDVTMLEAGAVWTDSSGATLTVLWPETETYVYEDENSASLVLLLEYGEFSALFTGDIGKEEEVKVADSAGDIDLLKVAHHGSRYSTSADFLSAVCPQVAVISCGEKNSYGHPHEETLKRLAEAGSRVFVTAVSGCIKVTANKNGITDVSAPFG